MMKDVIVTIRPTDIRAMEFENKFTAKPGEPMKINVKNNFGVKLNPAQPTMAIVSNRFEAEDEAKSLHFRVDTVTAVSVNTFVDNLDELIKKNYINDIMLAVNEKIRSTASMVGININPPAMNFPYRETSDSLDAEILGAN